MYDRRLVSDSEGLTERVHDLYKHPHMHPLGSHFFSAYILRSSHRERHVSYSGEQS